MYLHFKCFLVLMISSTVVKRDVKNLTDLNYAIFITNHLLLIYILTWVTQKYNLGEKV